MGNYDKQMCPALNGSFLKLIRTCIIVLCFSNLLLKCQGDETSNIYLSKNAKSLKILSNQEVILKSSNKKVSSKNKDELINKRFRRNPSPNPLAEVLGSSSINSGSNFRIPQEQVQNSHKPIFERCDEYQPSVEEESARGKG